MQQEIIFRDLPATFPQADRFWGYAAVSSILVHALMLVMAILIPLMFTSTVPDLRLLVSVIAPPPAAPPVDIAVIPKKPSVEVAAPSVPSSFDSGFVAPIAVPADIVRVVEDPAFDLPSFGVPGGMPGGTLSEFLRDVVQKHRPLEPASTYEAPPPPARPSEPAVLQEPEAPIRLNEYYPLKMIRVVPPEYPMAAKLSRIQGTVFLDLTVSESGKVEEIRVVSGEPILVQAAVSCVRNWIYAPPVLNGKPARVIIPVRVNFKLEL
jgi:protein TonB